MRLNELTNVLMDDVGCILQYAKKAGDGRQIAWEDVYNDIGDDVKLSGHNLKVECERVRILLQNAVSSIEWFVSKEMTFGDRYTAEGQATLDTLSELKEYLKS